MEKEGDRGHEREKEVKLEVEGRGESSTESGGDGGDVGRWR